MRFTHLTLGFVSSALLWQSGCTAYRPEPLTPKVEMSILRQRSPLSIPLSTPKIGTASNNPSNHYDASDGLNEAEMVTVALSFNPDLRNRRHDISQIGHADLFGMIRFKPEMRVNIDQATVGLATDSDMLYTLLMPNLRQAWRDDESARRDQSSAEMLVAEAKVVLEVRRTHVTVLAHELRLALARARHDHRQQLYRSMNDDPMTSAIERALALVAWQRSSTSVRVTQGVVDDERRELNSLLGFDPGTELRLSDQGKNLLAKRELMLSTEQLDQQLLKGRFELKIEEALYRRAEFSYSQAIMGQYPKLRLGPAVTYDREEGTSFKLGASVRLPWPDDAAQRAEDASIERDRARASYVAKLHALRAEAHKANARLARAITELDLLESQRAGAQETKSLADIQRRIGAFSLSDYLPMIERCEAVEWEWVDAALDYRLASIDLDHATGRLNRYGSGVEPASVP
jgi:outer membrane protein TolC